MKDNDLLIYLKNQKKQTIVKVYCKGNFLNVLEPTHVKCFKTEKLLILIGDYKLIDTFLNDNKENIEDYYLEYSHHNALVPLLKYYNVNARIEHGAIIRDNVTIGDNAIILMGAVINVGASIGANTMIDMNAVIGSRAIIGANCHISAGAVIAGVLEPISAKPVIIEDGVIVGANAVILEGVHIHKNAVIAAGSIVTNDVYENEVYAGNKARFIKYRDESTNSKTILCDDLR